MKVPGKPRRLEIDFVRGIAILLVMFDHFRKPHTGVWLLDEFSDALGAGGGHGVDLFFVLSGFLVGGLLLREYRDSQTLKPGRFLVRRMFKIWPAYYFLIFFQLFIHRHPASTFFWQNFFHLQNYLGSSLLQTWSLGVEEHFYLFLRAAHRLCRAAPLGRDPHPEAARRHQRRGLRRPHRRRLFSGYTVAALMHSELRMDSLLFGVNDCAALPLQAGALPPPYPAPLAAGCANRHRHPLGTATVRTTGSGSCPTRARSTAPPTRCSTSPAAPSWCSGMEHSGRLPENPVYKFVSVIGVYSYGLYLWHSAFLSLGDKLIARFHPIPAFFLALGAQFVAACIVGYITTRLIEWPALYWRESVQWLKDSKPLAKSPDEQGRQPERAGGDHERGAEAVLVSK